MWLVGAAWGACGPGYGRFREHLEEKLANPNGEPGGGADTYTGANAVFLYLSCNEESTTETHEPVGGTAKVAVHELQHVYQVQMLRGTLTSLTPPTDTLGDQRFQVKNYHSACPAVYETAIKGVLDALPASQKLLTVPTYAILVPETRGIGDAAQVQAAADELEALILPPDCTGVVLDDSTWWHKESNQMAEGEAEWYAEGVLMAPGANAYNDANMQWDGAAAWAQRMRENMGRMSGSPGKQLFHLPLTFGEGNVEWSDTLRCLGWNNNAVGELTYHYLKTHWRPSTTHEETRAHWLGVHAAATYEAGFEAAFGDTGTWEQFVCALETHYGIERRIQTCAGVEVAPVRPDECAVIADDPDVGLVVGLAVAGVALVSAIGLGAWGWSARRGPPPEAAPALVATEAWEFASLRPPEHV